MLPCPWCASTDVVQLDIGDDQTPGLIECESCGQQFEDPDHPLAG